MPFACKLKQVQRFGLERMQMTGEPAAVTCADRVGGHSQSHNQELVKAELPGSRNPSQDVSVDYAFILGALCFLNKVRLGPARRQLHA